MKKLRDILVGLFNIIFKILFEYSKYVLIAIVAIVSAQVVARNLFNGEHYVVSGGIAAADRLDDVSVHGHRLGKNLHIEWSCFIHFFPSRYKSSATELTM